jgi:hypothetical protein
MRMMIDDAERERVVEQLIMGVVAKDEGSNLTRERRSDCEALDRE